MWLRARRAGAGWCAAGMIVAAPAWGQTTPAGQPARDGPATTAPDGSAVMAPLPGIGVDWPDLATAPGAPAAAAATTRAAGDTRYGVRLDGLGAAGTPLLRERFDGASALRLHGGDVANAAQLDRRAREDAALLVDLLRAEGYYDAQVATRIDRSAAARPVMVLAATPGALYRFGSVTVSGLASMDGAAALRGAYRVKANDPVDADAIAAAQAGLLTRITDSGYPFAVVAQPEIVLDRASRSATLALAVTPGGARRFGRITANPDNHVFDADHVADIARFRPGETYDASELVDLKRALIQTGLVSVADVKPVEGSAPGTVDVAVHLERAPPHTIAGELGYGAGEGARAELSWTHRNLFPPEGALTLRGVLGTLEQSGSVVFRRNNFEGRDRVLTAQLDAAHTIRDAYDARTLTLSGTLERQTNIFFQKKWTWSLGGELVASDERDTIVDTGAPRRQTYFIIAAPTSLTYDGSNDLLNPTRGFRLGGRLSPELSLEGAAFGYARAQIDASAYRSAGARVVIAGRVRLGTILGAPRDAVAPSRRFYAGGGASVRGYAYQDIGPRDVNNDPIGGRSLTEFSLEARVRTFGSFGLVPFLDAGTISTGELPPISGLHYGTGLGVRYYSNFGPIRLDVGTPINPQPGDKRIAVYVSLGQAF